MKPVRFGLSRLKRFAGCSSMPIGLGLLLAFTSGNWFIQATIAPLVAQAYTSRTEVTLDLQPNEPYDVLLRRAEAVARAATQRSFDRDILITDVAITILAQSQTAIVPILSVNATRAQWRSRPDSRSWATYYTSSKLLLGFDGTQPSPAAAPAPSFSPTPAQPSSIPGQTVPNASPVPPRSPGITPPSQPADAPPAPTPVPSSPSEQTPVPPDSETPATQPGIGPIIPDRIPTPADIGK